MGLGNIHVRVLLSWAAGEWYRGYVWGEEGEELCEGSREQG